MFARRLSIYSQSLTQFQPAQTCSVCFVVAYPIFHRSTYNSLTLRYRSQAADNE